MGSCAPLDLAWLCKKEIQRAPLERLTGNASANHLRRSTQPRRGPMIRTLMIGAVSATALALSAAAFAQQGGTAQEARAMLDKAVAAVKADQAVALAMFIKGEGG